MGRTVILTPKQKKQLNGWIDANYDWAKARFVDNDTQEDINLGIETEKQAIAGNLLTAMLVHPDLQLKVFGNPKVF